MQHLDEDTLALLALGEQVVSEAQLHHVAGCPQCRAELETLQRVVVAGRSADLTLQDPGSGVWSRIDSELARDAESPPETELSLEKPADAPTRTATEPDATADTSQPGGTGGAPIDRQTIDRQTIDRQTREPRRSRSWRTAWVAAAAFLLGVGATVVVDQLRTPTAPEPVATAELQPLPAWPQAQGGTAVLQEVDGNRVLDVGLDANLGEGFREVWLIDSDLERLVSLGILTGDEGVFEVPDGLDLDDFVIVDVSDEPYDGDPAHSGNSIVRGELS